MSFPQTRLSLIHRIVREDKGEDWRQFMDDYWRPVCQFASRWGGVSVQDAEDVAARTFEALVSNQLLTRWQANRTAKLRSLLCQVVRNILANRARRLAGRKRGLRRYVAQASDDSPIPVHQSSEPAIAELDQFYAAWVDDLLMRCVENLMTSLHGQGKGDYFRVLYGRLCDDLTTPEISKALGIKITSAENYFKAARRRLADVLERTVREHIERYTDENETEDEFQREWATLGEYLRRNGGLEYAVRRVFRESPCGDNVDDTSL